MEQLGFLAEVVETFAKAAEIALGGRLGLARKEFGQNVAEADFLSGGQRAQGEQAFAVRLAELGKDGFDGP
jgi:hypothetical protein